FDETCLAPPLGVLENWRARAPSRPRRAWLPPDHFRRPPPPLRLAPALLCEELALLRAACWLWEAPRSRELASRWTSEGTPPFDPPVDACLADGEPAEGWVEGRVSPAGCVEGFPPW